MTLSSKISKPYLITVLVTILFVVYILITKSNDNWEVLLLLLLAFQIGFKPDASMLIPILVSLTLTEYYFLISGKRFYFAEFLFYPLVVKYLISTTRGKISKLSKQISIIIILLVLVHLINYFLGFSDFLSILYRLRSFAFPFVLIFIVANLIKDEVALKRMINIIIIISLVATIVVYLQYYTGNFYILQKSLTTEVDSQTYMQQYVQGIEDSILFSYLGLKILGAIPPVGLNYYKFGYSEKIIVPFVLCFSFFLFSSRKRKKIAYLILSMSFFIATLLTGSRSILLTLIFAPLILLGFQNGKIKWKHINFIIFSFFGFVYLLAPTLKIINLEEFGTLLSRIFYMDDFYKFISNNTFTLLFGNNPDTFMTVSGSGQPPHHFLAFGIIYEGVIITIVIFGVLYLMLKKTFYLKGHDGEVMAIHYGLWASIFAFVFIYGQTSYVTWSTPHNMFFYIIIGLLISSYNIINQRNDLYSHSRIQP